MALPPGIKLVTVNIGPFVDFQGNPVAGRTTFSPSTSVLHAATGTPVLNRPVVVELDPAGMGVVTLPATDDTALTPTGFVYYVQHAFTTTGAVAPSLATIALPQGAPVVDLDLLVPVTGASGVVVSLPSVISVAGKSGVVSGADIAADPTVRAAFETRQKLNVVFEGDSLTFGSFATSGITMPILASSGLDYLSTTVVNHGTPGDTLANMVGVNMDALLTLDTTNVLTVWAGTNDLVAGTDPTDLYNQLRTYCLARRAAGWKVVVVTMLSRLTSGSFTNAKRATFNGLVRTNWATFADGLADIANDGVLGIDGAETTSGHYYIGDKVHLRNSGYRIVAGYVRAALRTLGLKYRLGESLHPIAGAYAPSSVLPDLSRFSWVGWNNGTGTTIMDANGRETAIPIFLPDGAGITNFGVSVTTPGSAGALIRLGLRADDRGAPGALIKDGGTVDATVAGSLNSGLFSAVMLPSGGRFWLTATPQGAPTTLPTIRTLTSAPWPRQGGSNGYSGGNYAAFFQNGVTGALPAAWGGGSEPGQNLLPAIEVRLG